MALNNTDEKQEKFIIIDNKESRLAVRHLYEELSVYLKYLLNNTVAEVNAPNKDIALKINKILNNCSNKISVKCPNCKTEIAYNDLMNQLKDPEIEEYIKKLRENLDIAETCLYEIYDHLNNRNLFKDYSSILEMCIDKNFKSALCFKYLLEKENFRNYEEAEKNSVACEQYIKEIAKKAEEGNKYIQTLIGRLAKNGGCGIRKSSQVSLQFLTKAVENKHRQAYNSLGYLYLKGVDKIYKDTKQAIELFQIGSNEKQTNCMVNLGWCYDYGIGVEQNHYKAFELYKDAAFIGNINAMSSLGYSYRHGQGCEKNPKKCIEWLTKASDLGDAAGQLNLGFCFEIGFGVKEDKQAAFKLFKNAAESNYGPACSNVGFCYENGFGVNKSLENAFLWYKKGAELGHTKCMCSVGMYYIKGIIVAQNTQVAMNWFNMAIDRGDKDAKYVVEFIRDEKLINSV